MGKRAKTRTDDKKCKVPNWPEHNGSLVKRGDVTLWLEEDVIISWPHENAESKVGAPYTYRNEAILCVLSMREVFRVTYCQTEGFGRSLVRAIGVDLKIPDYTSHQKRAATLELSDKAAPFLQFKLFVHHS